MEALFLTVIVDLMHQS